MENAQLQNKEQNDCSTNKSVAEKTTGVDCENKTNTEVGVPLFMQQAPLFSISSLPPPIQRQNFDEDEETTQTDLKASSIQRQSFEETEKGEKQETPIFPKLTIGNPNDIYEQEADHVAEAVMRLPESETFDDEETNVQTKPIANHITNFIRCMPNKETKDKKQTSLTYQSPNVERTIEDDIQSSRGRGRFLPSSERLDMEEKFGEDFSQVHIHTDTKANKMSNALRAKAFTSGNDIYFGDGQFEPDKRVGKQLLAHELTHVVQQTGRSHSAVLPLIQRDHHEGESEGEVVTEPEEQRRRFIEAFRVNPGAAMESIGDILETGGGSFEVYGLVYYDINTEQLIFERRHSAYNQIVLQQLGLLVSRGVTEPETQINYLIGLLRQLVGMGEEGAGDRVENWFNNPSEALQTLDRVTEELNAGHSGYPAVTDDQLEQVSGVIEAFATSRAFSIPLRERPRPEGRVLLGYFHSHQTTLPPSGVPGIQGTEGDIGMAVSEGVGSFMITGTPANPRIFFIAEGRWWEITAAVQNAIEQQAQFILGFDQALGGLFFNVISGAEGFQADFIYAEQPTLNVAQSFVLGDYRLSLEGSVNPVFSSTEGILEGPERRRLTTESAFRGGMTFNFTSQPYIPGTLSIEYLGAGAFTVQGRISPWPIYLSGITLGGGATVFEGHAGLESEGFIEVGMQGISPLFVPSISPPGEIGAVLRWFPSGGHIALDAFYENPWFRLDYFYTRPEEGDSTHGFSGTFNWQLPTGSLRLQLGYQEGIFGNIGYQMPLP